MSRHNTLRGAGILFFAIFLAGIPAFGIQAQSVPAPSATAPSSSGSIHGVVTDSAGDVVVGANVTLVPETAEPQRTLLTDSAGSFNFTGVDAGTFELTVTATGFAPWVGPKIVLTSGEDYRLPDVTLEIAAANTSVMVNSVDHELAEEQVHAEEKQRVLGIVPNFYTSYVWDAQPLTSGQKFRLAIRASVDPVAFIGTGVIAGIQQWQNDFSGYGQGAQGYAKRYGANYADGFTGTMIGGWILPSILHQDPRYFYKGTGSIRSRTLYAISTVFITKGDNGRWQPNYSNLLGTFATGGISNIYYPPANRGIQVTVENSLLGLATGAASALLQEFVIKKISRGVPPSSGMTH